MMSDLPQHGDQPPEPSAALEPPASPESEGPPPAAESAEPPLMPADVEKEVSEAMAEMSADELAELGGDVGPAAVDVIVSESLEPGTELIGTIVGVSEEDVFLEFGVKSQGVMLRSQFGKKEPLEIGRRVDVVVDSFDRGQDLLIVSRKGELQRATWANLRLGMIVQGRVTGLNKGGLEVDINGLRAFMPTSQVDIAMLKDISVLLNEVIQAEVIELDRREKNILISRRKLMQRRRQESRQHTLDEIETGQIRKGVVGNLTKFGAFVDLGGIDGLVHISDIRWGQVENVSDFLQPGQEVEVKVLKVDKKRERISLGIKQNLPDPWQDVPERYPVGTQLKVRVVRLADFGVFVELEPGVEALIPISELSWTRVGKAAEVVTTGDIVDAVVIRLEPGKRRLALSSKQATPDPWGEVLESYPAKSLVKGKVTRLADFGVFVELTPGVEGLIHISELADRHVNSCGEVVQAGDEVETRVLGVDAEKRRISLSIKAVAEAPLDEAAAGKELKSESKLAKKRKKPLRGGLSSHWDWGGGLNLDPGEGKE